jgi:ABC-type multidrug transport system fused ATPase/permease subunit
MISWIPPEIRWLSRQVRPFLRWHAASFVCISIGSSLGLLAPLILKSLIDRVLPSRSTGLLIGAISLIFLCQQGRAILTSVGSYLTMRAAQRLALDLRLRLLRHLDTLSADYHERTPVGASLYPLTEPIDEVSYFGSDILPSILRTLTAMTLTLGTMLLLNARMTLAILPLIPIFLLTRNHFRARLEDGSDAVQSKHIAWSSFLEEHLSSMVAVQLLRQERRRERTAFHLLAAMVRSYKGLLMTGVWFTLCTSLTIAVAMAAVLGLGGRSVFNGSLTLGGLVAFYTYLTQLFEPLSGAAETYVRAQKTFTSIRQLQTVIELKPAIKTDPTAVRFPEDQPWTIEIADVVFRYRETGGRLSIAQLNIRAGEQVAMVGANGAGKSTLAKLLVRLYDADAGSIVVAGRDLRQIEIESLRQHVCYAPPHTTLFDTTLASNLRMGKTTASDAELQAVVEDVGLTAWIASLPSGLDQPVRPGGFCLSNGQRQRLGIARAILQHPRVLILDEATSSLDACSEQELLSRLRDVLPGSTLIVISHRLSALRCVGRVIVFEAGRIVEDTSPDLLLTNGNAYSRLFHPTVWSAGHREVNFHVSNDGQIEEVR